MKCTRIAWYFIISYYFIYAKFIESRYVGSGRERKGNRKSPLVRWDVVMDKCFKTVSRGILIKGTPKHVVQYSHRSGSYGGKNKLKRWDNTSCTKFPLVGTLIHGSLVHSLPRWIFREVFRLFRNVYMRVRVCRLFMSYGYSTNVLCLWLNNCKW